jgi:hypothetical protein
MDFKRTMELAGVKALVENTLTESNYKIEVHVSKKGQAGVLGDVIVIDAFEGMDELAAILGIPDGWKMTKVKNGFAAYNKGDRMSFFTNDRDFEPDEE